MEREKEMEKRYIGISLVDVCALGVAGDCPKQLAVSIYDRCGVFIADRLPDSKK